MVVLKPNRLFLSCFCFPACFLVSGILLDFLAATAEDERGREGLGVGWEGGRGG
jgi:hypothetical protein